MVARFISDRRKAVLTGAGAFALALVLIVSVAVAQRAAKLDWLNMALMTGAGRMRDTGIGAVVTPIMQAASLIGGTLCRLSIIAIIIVGMLWRKTRQRAVWLFVAAIGGTLLNVLIKQIFVAPRPDLLPHLDIVNSYSFPSSHAAANLALYGALAMLAGRPVGYVGAACVAVLIGISRVWLGVHWPSDVMAGWIEAIGWLSLLAPWLPARGGEQQRV